jgi:hypothetical protein
MKDQKLYLEIGFNDEKCNKIFEFNNKKLIEIPMTDYEIDIFDEKYSLPTAGSLETLKTDLGNGKFFILEVKPNSYTDYRMYVEDRKGNKKDISKDRYFMYAFRDYMYIDKDFQKVYMVCIDKKEKKHGLYVYDINNDKFYEKYVSSEKKYDVSIKYRYPMRVPNTQYLMYIGLKDERNWAIYIEEIPEWKSELEKKEKTK